MLLEGSPAHLHTRWDQRGREGRKAMVSFSGSLWVRKQRLRVPHCQATYSRELSREEGGLRGQVREQGTGDRPGA